MTINAATLSFMLTTNASIAISGIIRAAKVTVIISEIAAATNIVSRINALATVILTLAIKHHAIYSAARRAGF